MLHPSENRTRDLPYESQAIPSLQDEQCPKKVKVVASTKVSDDGVAARLLNKDPSAPQPNNKGKDVLDLQEINVVSLKNSFDALMEKDKKFEKVEAPPKKTLRKTGIWTGRKADSPKKNTVFSPETMVYYFNRDDMIFDDMRQAAEEVKHENAYSTNGLWSSYGY
ncbi:hypothetical protein Tco_0662485 [Tanacetum coccineum]